MGKEQPITYLLLVDRNLATVALEILIYREDRGGEIRRESWRRKFRGKRAEDDFRVGEGVDAISGATISTTAVARGVQRLLRWLRILDQQGGLPR